LIQVSLLPKYNNNNKKNSNACPSLA